ncbi:MAG: hypothetical protein Q9227_005161 [Pyrenula ochraceoflavens]
MLVLRWGKSAPPRTVGLRPLDMVEKGGLFRDVGYVGGGRHLAKSLEREVRLSTGQIRRSIVKSWGRRSDGADEFGTHDMERVID